MQILCSAGPSRPCVHFVGFRDDRFWNALAIFGPPDFIHRKWDHRAQREIAPGDVAVHADGEWDRPPSRFNGADIDEPEPPA